MATALSSWLSTKSPWVDPNREKANWAYPLYQCYYSVYGANDPKTKELEAILKQ